MYYKPAKLAVEYESFAYHNSPSEQGKDVMRSAILGRQGVEVMRLSTIQLYNKDACMDFAFNLASRLRKRLQIRAKKFDEMHMLLRALLPSIKPVAKADDRKYKCGCGYKAHRDRVGAINIISATVVDGNSLPA